MEKAQQKVADDLLGLKAALDKALYKKNATECVKCQTKLEVALEKHRATALSGGSTLRTCYEDVQAHLEQARPEVERLTLRSERADIVTKSNQLLTKLRFASSLMPSRFLEAKMQTVSHPENPVHQMDGKTCGGGPPNPGLARTTPLAEQQEVLFLKVLEPWNVVPFSGFS